MHDEVAWGLIRQTRHPTENLQLIRDRPLPFLRKRLLMGVR